MQDSPIPSEPTLLAAEYVLRLLDAESERAVEARLQTDAALRREVRLWAGWLGGLAHDLAPSDPPETLRRTVADRLFRDI